MSRYAPSLGAGQSPPAPLGAFRADLARFQGRFGIGATRYDEEQEKALALLWRLGGHFRPQCGRFQGLELALF